VRRAEGLSNGRRTVERAYLAAGAAVITSNLVTPQVYAAAGLDVDRAVAEARSNKHYQDKLRTSASKLMGFLDDVGLVGGPSRRLYEKVNLR